MSINANRIFTAKNDFTATVSVDVANDKLISEFKDDQYHNTLDEFYSTIFSNDKKENHYIANTKQSKLMDKIFVL